MNLPALTATPVDAPIEHIRLQYANDGFLLLSGLIDEATSRSASELLLQLPGMDANNAVIAPPDLYNAQRELVEHYARQDEVL